MPEQQKAPDDGVYTLDGKRFRARKGVLMPPGATFGDAPAEKSKGKGGKRPAATTASTGPKETTGGSGPAETE